MSGLRRPNLSRDAKLSGTNGDREKNVFLVQLTTSRTDNRTRLFHSLLKELTIHILGECKHLTPCCCT